MDLCGDSDRSGIASFRRTSAVDTCVPGPASQFGPWPVKPPERPTRREQRCRQRDNISALLHEPLSRGHAIRLPKSAHPREALAQFRNEQLRLLESSEVTAL